MLISATRTVSALTLKALFYGALFVVVVVVHVGLTAALRQQGWSGGASLLASGAVVLAVVLALVNAAEWLIEKRAARREIARMHQGLPGGPCCVIWRTNASAGEAEMPWRIAGPLRARYPRLARQLGVEGVAVVEFEVSAQGLAKNMNCRHAWPSDVFYQAAREALSLARFEPKPGADVRYGASYQMAFVFRIAGASRLNEAGTRARPLRPILLWLAQGWGKLRRSAIPDSLTH